MLLISSLLPGLLQFLNVRLTQTVTGDESSHFFIKFYILSTSDKLIWNCPLEYHYEGYFSPVL